jgi:hypothetical protein
MSMSDLLLSPPVAFFIVLLTSLGLYALMGKLRFRPRPGEEANKKPYACGEESNVMVRPDYGQVFPFAFFFTLLHVVALMATTVPYASPGTLAIAVVYVIGAVIGLFVLYRN